MKVIKYQRPIISKCWVEYNNDVYQRIQFNDGEIKWDSVSFDGEMDNNEELEREFQKMMINNLTINHKN